MKIKRFKASSKRQIFSENMHKKGVKVTQIRDKTIE